MTSRLRTDQPLLGYPQPDGTVKISAVVKKRQPKAYEISNERTYCWIPRSQIVKIDRNENAVYVTKWIAEKKPEIYMMNPDNVGKTHDQIMAGLKKE